MKKILGLSILLFSFFLSYGQIPNRATVSNAQTRYEIPNMFAMLSSKLPVVDTLNNKATPYPGALTILPGDTLFHTGIPPIYMSNGRYWGRIGGGGGGSGIDSLTFPTNPAQICVWSGGVSTCYNLNQYYDSTSYNSDSTYYYHWSNGSFVDSVWNPHTHLYARTGVTGFKDTTYNGFRAQVISAQDHYVTPDSLYYVTLYPDGSIKDSIQWTGLSIAIDSGRTLVTATTLTLQSVIRGGRVTAIVTDTLAGGAFNFSSDALTDDYGIIFPAYGGGHWVRDISQSEGMNIQWFGAKPETGFDNVTAIRLTERALERLGGGIYIPRGTWEISDSLKFSGAYNVDVRGTLLYTGAEVPYPIVTIGNDSFYIQFNNKYYIENLQSTITTPTDTLFVGVHLLNIVHATFRVMNIIYFGTGLQITSNDYDAPFAYNTVYLPHIFKAIHCIKFSTPSSSSANGWINQNTFNDGSLHSSITGAIGILMRAVANSNTFNHTSIEVGLNALCGIQIDRGTYNTFTDIRNEQVGIINTPFFICNGTGTFRNVVNVQTNDFGYLHSMGVEQNNGAFDNYYIDYFKNLTPIGKGAVKVRKSTIYNSFGQDTTSVWWSALDSPMVVTDPIPSITFKQSVYTQALTQLGTQASKKGMLILGSYTGTTDVNEIRFGNSIAGGAGNVYVNNTSDILTAASDGILAMQFKNTGDIIIPKKTTMLGAVGIGAPATSTNALYIYDTTLSASGSLHGSALSIYQKWNTLGAPTAIELDIADSASGYGSPLLNFNVNSVPRFTVYKQGAATLSYGTGSIKLGDISSGSPNIKIITGAGQTTPYIKLDDAGNTLGSFQLEVGRASANRLGIWNNTTSTEIATFHNNGNFGVGVTLPTAVIQPKAGTTAASTAPFKYTLAAAELLTTPERGAEEAKNLKRYWTDSNGVRQTYMFLSDTTGAYLPLSGGALTGPVSLTDVVGAGSGSLAATALSIAQTWNTSGIPTAFKVNVTNTASNNNSSLFDFQQGGTSLLRLRLNTVGSTLNFGTGPSIGAAAAGTGIATYGGTALRFLTTQNTTVGYSYYFANNLVSSTTQTSGDNGNVSLQEGYSPTSGTGTYVQLKLLGTFNQTGGANGITRGLWVNNTLTSVADFRAIDITPSSANAYGIYQSGALTRNYFNGSTSFGTTTLTAKVVVGAGTATASTAPIKLTAGTVLTTPESGVLETNANNELYYSTSTTTASRGYVDLNRYVATATSLSANTTHSTIDVTATGQTITLPTAVGIGGRIYTIVYSAASGTATIATTSSQTFSNITSTPTTLTLAAPAAGAITSYTVQSNNATWIVINKVKNE